MFRLSQFMQEIRNPTPVRPAGPPGPVVIWNLIRRCNLNCRHCYSLSADTDFPGELTTEQIFTVMDDLKAFRVPVLILSGGEPLLRPDIFEISMRAKAMGFYVALSTNGTLIDAAMADRIADIGYDYLGISLSVRGARLCRDRGIKVGLRYTMTEGNIESLTGLLDLVDRERIDKFYLSHLVYAGRGNRYRGDDAYHQTTRQAMDVLFERCWSYVERGEHKEFVTGNNDADGVWFLMWIQRNFPDHADHMRRKLEAWGGNASGVNVANIDNLGTVHPDTMWWHHDLGNVKERSFSEIWTDVSDPVMAGLKASPRKIKGRCGACQHFAICGGNTRVRAQQLTGDPWEEDPACYLTDAEIGITGGPRVVNRPYKGKSDEAAALR
jgi:radical SAM protein with 4Fe4S-binding SPASM domain